MTIPEIITQKQEQLDQLRELLKDKHRGSPEQRLIWRRRRNDLITQIKGLKQ